MIYDLVDRSDDSPDDREFRNRGAATLTTGKASLAPSPVPSGSGLPAPGYIFGTSCFRPVSPRPGSSCKIDRYGRKVKVDCPSSTARCRPYCCHLRSRRGLFVLTRFGVKATYTLRPAFCGALGRTRTCDLLIRRIKLLFPAVYRSVRGTSLNRPFPPANHRFRVRRVPPNIARVGVDVGVSWPRIPNIRSNSELRISRQL